MENRNTRFPEDLVNVRVQANTLLFGKLNVAPSGT